MAVIKHVHKYRLVNHGSKEKPHKVYACADPACSHFMPSLKMALGKKTVCWGCGDTTVITNRNIRNLTQKPRCFKCRKIVGNPVAQEEKQVLGDAIEQMLAGLNGKL